MNDISKIIGEHKKFIDDVYQNLKNVGIDLFDFPLDHIAYRTTSEESYEKIKDKMRDFGEVVSEIIIRERPVAIIKLKKPLAYKGMEISYLEILSPARGDNFKEGLEHAEFVIDTQLSEMVKKYPSVNLIYNRKKINSELKLKFPNGANVKFHELPIDEVIRLQKMEK